MAESDVKTWQRALSSMGLYAGKIDGEFGTDARTHLCFVINMAAVPEGTELHICDPVCGVL